MNDVLPRDRVVFLALLLVTLSTEACVPEAVRWEEGSSVPPSVTEAWVPPTTPNDTLKCDSSLVFSRARGDTAFASWWTQLGNGRAALVVARSDDRGRSWRVPEVADSTDRSRSGCARPKASLAADTLNGYVHLAYNVVAPEGPGVFFTHSMGQGTMFHAPVPIVYGERISLGAVTSHGDTVAVAYENPNAASPQVWLALSRTTGHIFEHRTSVSSATVTATRPAVALEGAHVAVWWYESPRAGSATTVVARRGTLLP